MARAQAPAPDAPLTRRPARTGCDEAEARLKPDWAGSGVAAGRDFGIGTAAATCAAAVSLRPGAADAVTRARDAGRATTSASSSSSRTLRDATTAALAFALCAAGLLDATCVSGPLAHDARKLRFRHPRPVAHAADVHVDEGRAGRGIEADAAALQAQAGLADRLELDVRDEEVDRLAVHVLAVAWRPRWSGGAAWRWWPASDSRRSRGSAPGRRSPDRPPTARRSGGGPWWSGWPVRQSRSA